MISWMKKVSSIGLVVVLMATLLMSFPFVSAKPPGACEPWPECQGGEEPPADPAIAFFYKTSGPKQNKLMVMNADGSNKATIHEAYFGIYGNPSWSSDGASIAWAGYVYVPNEPSDRGVWRMDVSVVEGEPVGSNLQQLVNDEDCGFCIDAAWSPSRDEIVVAKSPSGPGQDTLFVVPSDGGPIETIYTAPEGAAQVRSPAWDSNGNRIAFIEKEVSTLDSYIRILDRWTGEVSTSMFKGQFSIRTLDWARQDTDTLVIDDESTDRIHTLDIGTETATYVVDGLQPGWSPDNSEIAYVSIGKKPGIHTIQLSNGEVTKLVVGGYVPGWRRF